MCNNRTLHELLFYHTKRLQQIVDCIEVKYAIIKTGGKQYTVAVGDKLRVESLAGEVGSQIELTQVLAIKDDAGMKVGAPTIEGAAVKATIVANGRHEKVRIFKFRRRKHSIKSAGHRQNYTELKIDEISA